MEKKIQASKQMRDEIEREFSCSKAIISQAVNYQTNTPYAKLIRKNLLQRGAEEIVCERSDRAFVLRGEVLVWSSLDSEVRIDLNNRRIRCVSGDDEINIEEAGLSDILLALERVKKMSVRA